MGWMKAAVCCSKAGSPGGDQRAVQRHIVANSPCVTSQRGCRGAERLWGCVAERQKRRFQKPRACPVSWVFLEPPQHLHFTLARPQSPTQCMLSAMPSVLGKAPSSLCTFLFPLQLVDHAIGHSSAHTYLPG